MTVTLEDRPAVEERWVRDPVTGDYEWRGWIIRPKSRAYKGSRRWLVINTADDSKRHAVNLLHAKGIVRYVDPTAPQQ